MVKCLETLIFSLFIQQNSQVTFISIELYIIPIDLKQLYINKLENKSINVGKFLKLWTNNVRFKSDLQKTIYRVIIQINLNSSRWSQSKWINDCNRNPSAADVKSVHLYCHLELKLNNWLKISVSSLQMTVSNNKRLFDNVVNKSTWHYMNYKQDYILNKGMWL